jgi:hypothetical protein
MDPGRLIALADYLDREADHNRDQAISLSYRMTPDAAAMITAHIALASYLRRESHAIRLSTADQTGSNISPT